MTTKKAPAAKKTSAKKTSTKTPASVSTFVQVDGGEIVDAGYGRNQRDTAADCTTAMWCPETHDPVRIDVKYTGGVGEGIIKIRQMGARFVDVDGDKHRVPDEERAQEIPLGGSVLSFPGNGLISGGYIEATYHLPVGCRADVFLVAARRP